MAAMVRSYEFWRCVCQLDVKELAKIPWARKPGLDLEGKGDFSSKVREFFKFQKKSMAAHHLLVQQLEKKFPDMFKAQKLIIEGKVVYLPGPSIALHHPRNSALLSAINGRRFKLFTSIHRGSHTAYNNAQLEVLGLINDRLGEDIIAATTEAAAHAAVRKAERRLARLIERCESRLISKNVRDLIPLGLARGSSRAAKDRLEDKWFDEMELIFADIP